MVGSYVNFRVFTAIFGDIRWKRGVGPTHKTSGAYPLNIRGWPNFAIINTLLRALDPLSVVHM